MLRLRAEPEHYPISLSGWGWVGHAKGQAHQPGLTSGLGRWRVRGPYLEVERQGKVQAVPLEQAASNAKAKAGSKIKIGQGRSISCLGKGKLITALEAAAGGGQAVDARRWPGHIRVQDFHLQAMAAAVTAGFFIAGFTILGLHALSLTALTVGLIGVSAARANAIRRIDKARQERRLADHAGVYQLPKGERPLRGGSSDSDPLPTPRLP